MGVGAWHLMCSERLEASIYKYIAPHFDEADLNATLEISIQPISNVVSIELTILGQDADELKPSDKLILDTLLVYIRGEVEPYMERELSLVARKYVDLYAMAIPYRMAMSLNVESGSK
jgi:hypothetical protein